MKTKFAIGCLVQWYESEIIEFYIESLKDAVESYDGEVIVDVALIVNTDLEKPSSDVIFNDQVSKIKSLCSFANLRVVDSLYTIADYRREFNDKYCTQVDVLVWGETDMLVPKQAFIVLDSLHQNVNTPKYLATFAICKMWDDSWKPLEHPEFTNKPFIEMDTENWWSLRYTMTKEEMDAFNNKVEDLDIRMIDKPKFDGSCLVLSSNLIKAGANIPPGFFGLAAEDTAFMYSCLTVLGNNYRQFVVKNILKVHNRAHPLKRKYVAGDIKDHYNPRENNKKYHSIRKLNKDNLTHIFNNKKILSYKDWEYFNT